MYRNAEGDAVTVEGDAKAVETTVKEASSGSMVQKAIDFAKKPSTITTVIIVVVVLYAYKKGLLKKIGLNF